MPQASVLLTFLAAALALNFTPGADMAYVVARSLAQGPSAGLLSALAITVGCMVHIGHSPRRLQVQGLPQAV